MGMNGLTMNAAYILRDVESGKEQYRLDIRRNPHPSADGYWDLWEVGVAPDDECVGPLYHGMSIASDAAFKRCKEMAPRYELWTGRKVEIVREMKSSRVLDR